MSLRASASATSTIEPVPQGTHLAVCTVLVDLGLQENKTYKKWQPKIMLGWEICGETYQDEDGNEKPKMIYSRYTNSLNDGAALRRDLVAWRGRDFTPEELDDFNLVNIVGKSCFITVIHNEVNGKKYANISSIAGLPKNVTPGTPIGKTLVFDLDDATLEEVDLLPEWIGKVIKQSSTYKDKFDKAYSQPAPVYDDLENDGQLPF